MKKTIAILITMLVLAISSINFTPKAKASSGCSSGSNASNGCFSMWHCVMIDGALYMQYWVCCNGHCFTYLEPV